MSTLPLALDIADAISQASSEDTQLCLDAKVAELLQAHPEAGASWSDVQDALVSEAAAAGVVLEAACCD